MPDSQTLHCYLNVQLAHIGRISPLRYFFKLSIAQMNASDSPMKSLGRAENLPPRAHQRGADFVSFEPQDRSNDQVAVRSHGVEIEPCDALKNHKILEAVATAIGVDADRRVA